MDEFVEVKRTQRGTVVVMRRHATSTVTFQPLEAVSTLTHQELVATSSDARSSMSDPEVPIGDWIDKLQARGSDEHGTHWPHLDDDERERRLRILANNSQSTALLLRLILEGEEVDSIDRGVWQGMLRLLDIQSNREIAMGRFLHAAMDWTHDWDGHHGHDVQEARDDFLQACRRRIEGADISQEIPQTDYELQDASWRRKRIKRWDVLPKTLAQMAQDSDVRTLERVLVNPFTPPNILERSLELLPFQSDAWTAFSDFSGPRDNKGLPNLPEWQLEVDERIFMEFEEENEDGDLEIEDLARLHSDHVLFRMKDQVYLDQVLENQRTWVSIAYNPSLPAKVLTSLWNQLGWHERERELRCAILMNPNCPQELLTSEAARVISESDIELLSLVANPQTPGNILHEISLMSRNRDVHYFDSVGGKMDDVLMGVAVHPNTSPETRAFLALIDSEQIATALRATA
jgi:hypothetical protein